MFTQQPNNGNYEYVTHKYITTVDEMKTVTDDKNNNKAKAENIYEPLRIRDGGLPPKSFKKNEKVGGQK